MNGFCQYPLRKNMYIYLTLLNNKVQISKDTVYLVDPGIFVSQIMTVRRHAYVSTAIK